jgi:hypothetical protein
MSEESKQPDQDLAHVEDGNLWVVEVIRVSAPSVLRPACVNKKGNNIETCLCCRP